MGYFPGETKGYVVVFKQTCSIIQITPFSQPWTAFSAHFAARGGNEVYLNMSLQNANLCVQLIYTLLPCHLPCRLPCCTLSLSISDRSSDATVIAASQHHLHICCVNQFQQNGIAQIGNAQMLSFVRLYVEAVQGQTYHTYRPEAWWKHWWSQANGAFESVYKIPWIYIANHAFFERNP